jgi:inosine-uridine nucleoside N-ribohydrolase
MHSPTGTSLYWNLMRGLAAMVLSVPAMWAAGHETIIVDTDSGLFGDDGAAVVMLLRSPTQVSVSGITVVPGNVWAPQGAEYMLHILDLLKRPDVAVYRGAQEPLMHTAAMAREYSRRWGPLEFIGAFAQDPKEVKPPPGAHLSVRRPHREHAVDFLIGEIERHPGELTILEIGPMTNLALALRMRPGIETKIKRLVFMGGNMHVGGNASALAEFNFWFDPEAAHIVLRADWPRVDVTTVDVSIKAPFTQKMLDEISKSQSPAARYIAAWSQDRYYMWDELAACAWLDPSLITKEKFLYMDVDLSHGPAYGDTLTWTEKLKPATGVRLVHAQVDVDLPRFQKMFLGLMTGNN